MSFPLDRALLSPSPLERSRAVQPDGDITPSVFTLLDGDITPSVFTLLASARYLLACLSMSVPSYGIA